ncbi:MAG TPA: RNA methyltransferase [Rhodanobacteraceae bacterium]|jgi:tRNA (cytidine32/uridine32-2'-O)-methyltransferase
MPSASAHLRFVLARTSHPGNIGSAARAIRTMGFDRLRLVSPHRYPDPKVQAMAAGADDVLAQVVVCDDVPDAIAECTRVYGLSARRRGIPLAELAPRAAAVRIAAELKGGTQVALLFGNEQSGLDNDELMRCHAMVRIPSVEDFSSLNLAQAVQVMAYEVRMAMLQDEPSGEVATGQAEMRDPPASVAEMEEFFAHLFRALHAIDFHKGRSATTIELRLRRLFQRAQPDARELRVLHGILADAERMARLAKGQGIGGG